MEREIRTNVGRISNPSCRCSKFFGWLIGLAALTGCGVAGSPLQEETGSIALDTGANFDPATCGTIRGRVLWQGAIPEFAAFDVAPNPLAGPVLHKKQSRPNPNR